MRPERMSPVYTGVTLVYVGLVLTLLVLIARPLLPHVFQGDLAAILQGLYWVSIGAIVLTLLGLLFCLGAPAEMPGKWAIIAAMPLLLAAGCGFLGLVLGVDFVHQLAFRTPHFVEYLSLAAIAGFSLFLVFLRGLGNYLGSDEDVSLATQSMVLGALLIAGYLFGRFVLFRVIVRDPARQGDAALIWLLVVIVIAVLFLMRYGRLLTYLRRDISRAMEEPLLED